MQNRYYMVFESALKEFNEQTTMIRPGAPLTYNTMMSRVVRPSMSASTLYNDLYPFHEWGVSWAVLKKVREHLTLYGSEALLYCFFHESGRKSKEEQQHRLIDGLVLTTGEHQGYQHLCTWIVNHYPSATDAVRVAREYICNSDENELYEEEGA